MLFNSHGNGNGLNDLHVLPEDEDERKAIRDWLDLNEVYYTSSLANVEGHEWYGGIFIEIPFRSDLREALTEL